MGRYTEKAVYVGFTVMCIAQRTHYFVGAALFHDITSLVFGLGLFVEGIRLI